MNTISTEVQVKRLESWLRLADPEFTSKGMVVDAKVRRLFMVELQNKITKEGRVLTVEWKNLGGGVYRCFLL